MAQATLGAIMARTAAYTGQLVRWSDMAERKDSTFYNLTLAPAAEDFEKGPVTAPPDDVPAVPGQASCTGPSSVTQRTPICLASETYCAS